jgi:cell division protein FtsA
MENNNIAVGLDIGTTKIVAMIGRKNEYGKLEILGVGKSKSLGVHRGVVNNITQTIQSIQQAVQDAESDATDLKIQEVVVGIAGQHIRSLQHSDYITRTNNADDVIDDNDIDLLINQVYKLVMLPGEEIIHVLPQEYKVDGQAEIKEPIGMYGGRLEANFHVVVGQVSSIRNIGRCVKSSGLDLAGITEDIKEGCSIIEKQAELLKIKFGSAWPGENKDNEIVSIPGLRGREPKEITLKNLSKIIHARVVEIIEQAYLEIKNYGHEEQKKKLIAGIVLTGGGSQLNHLKQLVEYITGMDTRIGYPNEHLAGDSDPDMASPLYATAVGLVMNAIENQSKVVQEEEIVEPPTETISETDSSVIEDSEQHTKKSIKCH